MTIKESQLQIGATGTSQSWSPVFPDNGGLLFKIRDLELTGDNPRIRFDRSQGMCLHKYYNIHEMVKLYTIYIIQF